MDLFLLNIEVGFVSHNFYPLCVSQFDDVRELTGHIESLLHFEDHFCKRENKAFQRVDQLKKTLLTLKDNHPLLRLQKNNQLSQLQTEIEKTRSEALSWVSDMTPESIRAYIHSNVAQIYCCYLV